MSVRVLCSLVAREVTRWEARRVGAFDHFVSLKTVVDIAAMVRAAGVANVT
jgi:hypothetical protein